MAAKESSQKKVRSFLSPIYTHAVVALICLMAESCFGASYYVSTFGNDGAAGSKAAPFHTSTKAFATGTAGDWFWFEDGVYNYCNISNPPSGSTGTPTVVKAVNDGMAIIDGNNARSGILIGGGSSTRAYITVEGFYVKNTSNNVPVEVTSPDDQEENDQTRFITMRRIGVVGSSSNASSVMVIARVRDSLFEDISTCGYGRYTFQTYGSNRLTCRRIYSRWDGIGSRAAIPTDPKFAMSVYDVWNSTFENFIILDSSPTLLTGDKGGLYLPGNFNDSTSRLRDSSYNSFYGAVILHSKNGNGIVSEAGTGNGVNRHNLFRDIVVQASSGTGISINKQSSHTILMNCTVSSSATSGIWSNSGQSVVFSSAINCFISSSAGNGVNGNWKSYYCNVFGNGTNYNGSSADATSISSATAMLYITTTPVAGPGAGKGEGGGDIGADVTKRYFNGVKSSEAWFPIYNQDRLKREMCEFTDYGWCASTQTLDGYVNGWLGHGTFTTPRPEAVARGQ